MVNLKCYGSGILRGFLVSIMSPNSRVSNFYTLSGKPTGYDRVRNAEIGNKDYELEVMEEAYTTEHWIVRIYKVKDMPNRGV